MLPQLPFVRDFCDSWNNPVLLSMLHLCKLSLSKLRMEMLYHQVVIAVFHTIFALSYSGDDGDFEISWYKFVL